MLAGVVMLGVDARMLVGLVEVFAMARVEKVRKTKSCILVRDKVW